MNLVSKLSARWARIYQQSIDRLANLQADLVNMACSINPKTSEDFITRRWLLKMSNACLTALETFEEATLMLDKKLENLGVKYGRQYDLIKGVSASDKKNIY